MNERIAFVCWSRRPPPAGITNAPITITLRNTATGTNAPPSELYSRVEYVPERRRFFAHSAPDVRKPWKR